MTEPNHPALRETGFFETLVEKGSDAIISIDEDSTIVYANEAVERVFGYGPAELEGEPLTTVMPERFQADHLAAVDRYLETGERGLEWTNIRLPGRHADGHEVPLSITFEEHDFEDRRLFSGIIRDVTQQEAYERTLETLQESARELMSARTKEEVADVTVSAAAEILGFPVSSVYVHDTTEDVLRPAAHSERVADIIGNPPTFGPGDSLAWEAFESGEAMRVEDLSTATDRHNPDTPLAAELVLPLGEHGVLLVAHVDPGAGFEDRDVDLAHLLAANAEAAMNRAKREAQLERQNEQLERFASILSHDLRDPLNSAQATLSLARAEHDSEYLADLADIHDRMAELIEDVLTLTRRGQSVGETERVDLGKIAREAWATVAGEEGAELSVSDDIGAIRADGERLRTLLENLFGNAVRHVGPDVAVDVGRLAGGGFYVADDGPGIPEDDRERVFEYGFTTGEDGTGLGLNIVREIANAHGWRTRLVESDGGGARFEFAFGGDGVGDGRTG